LTIRHVTASTLPGAGPAIPDIPGGREAGHLTSSDALDLDHVPESIAVIGSGYIALEPGQLLRRLGARVTLPQRGPRLLPADDPEIGQVMAGVPADEGIAGRTGVRYLRVDGGPARRTIHLEVAGGRRVVEATEILVAAGRQPNTDGLRLDRAVVRVGARGEVVVDGEVRSSAPRPPPRPRSSADRTVRP